MRDMTMWKWTKKSKKVGSCANAFITVKRNERLVKSQMQNIISLVYRLRLISSNLQESWRFPKIIEGFDINKSTIMLKLNYLSYKKDILNWRIHTCLWIAPNVISSKLSSFAKELKAALNLQKTFSFNILAHFLRLSYHFSISFTAWNFSTLAEFWYGF